MRNFIAAVCLTLVALFGYASSCFAQSLCSMPRSTNPGLWDKYCGSRTPTPSGAQQPAPPAPPPDEAEGRELNEKGIDAYNNGNYESARDLFQEALDKWPNNSTIQENLQKAKDQIAYQAALRKQKQDQEFIRNRQEALGQLKGISNSDDSGLKGVGSTDSGLKDAPNSIDSNGLKTLPRVNTDPMVVDARNVPSGLPKSVDAAIPHTPAGDRMRKGYQAIQVGDWKVALAWFQDALKKEPGDPDLLRLIDLAQFTLVYRAQPQTTPLPNQGSTINSTGDAAAKSGDTGIANVAANGMAARARADIVFKRYVAKYGQTHGIERTAAVQAAMRGEGYTKEELKKQLHEALLDYHKRHANSPTMKSVDGGRPPTADEIIIGGKG